MKGKQGLEKLISAVLEASSTAEPGSGGKQCKATTDALAEYDWKNFTDSTYLFGNLTHISFITLRTGNRELYFIGLNNARRIFDDFIARGHTLTHNGAIKY